MATTPPGPARALRASDGALELSEFFAPQRTPSTALPDPEPFLRNLTRGVLEVLAGVREVDQLARWLTEDPYRKLVDALEPRRARPQRPRHRRRSARCTRSCRCATPRPVDGVVEAVVDRAGSRAHARRRAAPRGHGRALARDIPRPALTPQTDERADPSVVAGPLVSAHSSSMRSRSFLSASRISVWSC